MKLYAKTGADGQGLIIDEADGRTVAVAYDGQDAALLAAAPDMQAALISIEARLTACARAFYGDGTSKALMAALKGWKDDIGPARAAIAKAQEVTQ
jgi:hypothetical protein